MVPFLQSSGLLPNKKKQRMKTGLHLHKSTLLKEHDDDCRKSALAFPSH